MMTFRCYTRPGNYLLLVLSIAALTAACGRQAGRPVENSARPSIADAEREGEQIAQRYRALDNSNQSVSKTVAVVKDADGSAREVAMSISRKLAPDGRRLMLVEFTSPAEERDRNALVITSPQGNIGATRYIQSNDTFAIVNTVASEDSLFGLTMQELADGQTEKYSFRLVGEETVDGKAVYRIEGKLKEGMESKFPRIVLLISKENYAALVAEFYDIQNQLLRRVTIEEMARHNGHWTRMRWIVDNLSRQKKISFETVKIAYDAQLSDAVFSRDHLKKITTR